MTDKIKRLDYDDLEPNLKEALRPRVERLKYLGEFFRCMGHQPAALNAFIDFTETAKGNLAKDLVETIALTIATLKQNDYERNQHERLSVRLGYGRDWVKEVEALAPDASAQMTADQKTLQRYVIKAIRNDGKQVTAELEAVIDMIGEESAVAVLMVIGRYAAHAIMVNSLGIAPPVPSIWEDGFDG